MFYCIILQILKYMYDHNLGDRQEKAMADYIVQLVGSYLVII